MRKNGRVRWFDAVKGYGFIIVEGVGDVLVHRSVLQEKGLVTLKAGALVEFEMVEKKKGLQVKEIFEIDDPGPQEMPKPRAPRPRETGEFVAVAGEMEGQIKWFSRQMGYGFVLPDDGTDEVFVHQDTLRKSGIREVRMGQKVVFGILLGAKGRTASHIRIKNPDPDVVTPKLGDPARTATVSATDLFGELLWIDEARALGAIKLIGLEDLAFVPLHLLHAVGILDVKDAGRLICDVEGAPGDLRVIAVARLH